MTLSQHNLERTFDWLEAALAADTELAREFVDSREVYFAHRAGGTRVLDALAQRRHLEWFLFERFSPSRGGVPVEALVHASRADTLEADEGEGTREQALAAMLSSIASVFEVTGIVAGDGVWVRDLAGGGEYALEEPEASYALELGDLLVGRLYAVGDTLHRLSSAAGVFRDERLRDALRHDMERARASRRGSLRLSQAELEKMFWSQSAGGQRAVDRARTLLASTGLPPETVAAMLEELAAEPFDATQILPGAGDALGSVLARLALESEVDLEEARRTLFEAWAELSDRRVAPLEPQRAVEPRAARGPVDVQAAMEAFDRGRSEGRDLELLFRELERDLQLDEDEEPAEEAVAPDFPGAVGAVVEEYLWDLERQGLAARAQEHACLRKLGQFGTSIGVFENLSARDLLVFGSIWLPELGGLRGAEDARSMLSALESFCEWCEEQQEVPLKREYQAGAAALSLSLPRVTEANRHREQNAELDEGEVFEVAEVAPGTLALNDRRGHRRELPVDPRLTEHLRPGDRLRATVGGGESLHVFCCYPPESARIAPRS